MERARSSAAGGELTVTRPTIEGDPITTYFRYEPSSSVLQLFVDSTQDKFGSGEWSHLDCPDAQTVANIGDCQPAE